MALLLIIIKKSLNVSCFSFDLSIKKFQEKPDKFHSGKK